MAALQHVFRQYFETDMVLPAAKPDESESELTKRGTDTALSLLQNFDNMIHLNPLVVKVEKQDFSQLTEQEQRRVKDDMDALGISYGSTSFSASDWSHYRIVDRVVFALGLSSDVTYTSALRTTSNGAQAFTEAALGTLTSTRFFVGQGLEVDGDDVAKIQEATANQGEGEATKNEASGVSVVKFFENPDLDKPSIRVIEHVVSRAVFGLHLFIAANIRESHKVLHERLKAEWEKCMNE